MREVKPPKISSSRNKLSSKTNPLDTAANLAEKRLKAGIENSAPYNTLIGDVAGQFSEGFKGDNDFDSIASGFFQGIQNVTKFNKMFENDKKYQEYQKVLDYFQQVNNQKLQQQQYHDKLANAQEQLRPMALAYFGNQKKDPQTAFISGQQMWNKYKELTGEPGEFLGWTPLDQNIAMIKGNDGEVELLDIRPLLLGDQYTENQIAALDQDYQNRMQDQRQENDRYFDLEDRKVQSGEALNRKRMDVYDAQINKLNKGEGELFQEEDEEIPLSSFDAVTRRGFVTDARSEINASKEAQGALRILDELEKLSEDVPDISSLWTRNAPFGALSSKDQAAIKKYEKYQSQIAQPLIRARGSNITDAERNIIMSGIPNWTQPLEARRDNIRTKKRELETLIARGIYAGNALSRKVTPSQLGYERFLSSHPNLVAEGVNPTFVQTSDFRGKGEQNQISVPEAQNMQDEGLSGVSTEELLRMINNE